MRAPRATFGARRRLRESAAFREAFDQGGPRRGRFVLVWTVAAGLEGWRLGVVASKRTFPRAVDRSRVKRLAREAFRLNWREFPGAGNLVVVLRRPALGARRQDVETELVRLVREAVRDGDRRRCER